MKALSRFCCLLLPSSGGKPALVSSEFASALLSAPDSIKVLFSSSGRMPAPVGCEFESALLGYSGSIKALFLLVPSSGRMPAPRDTQ
jgi:hypothetical protein